VLDAGAWHFTARWDPEGPVVGYIRLATPDAANNYLSHAYLGPDRFTTLLDAEKADSDRVFEHSRLAVDAEARGLGLGTYMYAVAMAAARELGAQAMIGISGTADWRLRLYQRFGFYVVPGTRSYVEQYRTEDTCVIFNRDINWAGEFDDLVARIRQTLSVHPSPMGV
jgi:GNAT superfamily N-acetyltransferase